MSATSRSQSAAVTRMSSRVTTSCANTRAYQVQRRDRESRRALVGARGRRGEKTEGQKNDYCRQSAHRTPLPCCYMAIDTSWIGVPRNLRRTDRNPGTSAVVRLIIRVPIEDGVEPLDAELVRRAQGGERRHLRCCTRRHQAVIYRFACAMTGSAAVAEDVVQDVFLALMRDLERYDRDRSSLRTYLSRHRKECHPLPIAQRPASVVTRPRRRGGQRGRPGRGIERQRGRAASPSLPGALPGRYREVIVLCDTGTRLR